MTPLNLAKLIDIAALLVCGRTSAALQRLLIVIRDHGGTVPTPPDGTHPPPTTRPEPAAARAA